MYFKSEMSPIKDEGKKEILKPKQLKSQLQ